MKYGDNLVGDLPVHDGADLWVINAAKAAAPLEIDRALADLAVLGRLLLERKKLQAADALVSEDVEAEARHAEAIKIMVDAKKLLQENGMEVSLISRLGVSQWPVLMLEAGHSFADIQGDRQVRN